MDDHTPSTMFWPWHIWFDRVETCWNPLCTVKGSECICSRATRCHDGRASSDAPITAGSLSVDQGHKSNVRHDDQQQDNTALSMHLQKITECTRLALSCVTVAYFAAYVAALSKLVFCVYIYIIYRCGILRLRPVAVQQVHLTTDITR